MPTDDALEHLVPRARPTEVAGQIQQDLQDFADVFNGRAGFADDDFSSGATFVYGARIGHFGASEWRSEVAPYFALVNLTVGGVRVIEEWPDGVRALVNYNFEIKPGTLATDARAKALWGRPRHEEIEFKLSAPGGWGGRHRWLMVPPLAPPFAVPAVKPWDETAALDAALWNDWWALLGFYFSQKQPLHAAAPAQRSLEQLQDLGIAMLMLVEDYNGRYAFAPRYRTEALRPYLNNRASFFVPDSDEIYGFNANLSDKSLAQFPDPARTVLFYEGHDEKLDFRYDGKAAVGFVDGHAALIAPDEAKNLIWKP